MAAAGARFKFNGHTDRDEQREKECKEYA